jgi:hypothetical protein
VLDARGHLKAAIGQMDALIGDCAERWKRSCIYVIKEAQHERMHTVTANEGAFDRGDFVKRDPPFEFTFSTAGEFKYHCDHHGGMKGTVTVTAAKPEKPEK